MKNMEKVTLKDKIILVDADHVQTVANVLRSDFERMLKRPIEKVDMAAWLLCCALDANWKGNQNEVQVVFVHSEGQSVMADFLPGDLAKEVDGKAFRDEVMGEFLLSAVKEESINAGKPLFVQCFQALVEDKKKRSVILVPNLQRYGDALIEQLEHENECTTTMLSMLPFEGKSFAHVVLGFSLIKAMGIRSEEFE